MDFRQLRYFVAVAEELSFSRAAQRLHVSQPPLSMQIKAIERELGTSLFARTKRSVALTPAGQVLLRQARSALIQLDHAEEMARRAGRGETGRLMLAFTSSAPLLDIFTQVLRRFRRFYPDASIEARLMSTGDQLTALAEGKLDVGILRPSCWFRPAAGLTVRRLWRDELHVFLPDDHPLLKPNRAIAPGDLAGESFIAASPDMGCGLTEHMNMLCSNAGFRPRITQEVDAAAVILGLVAAGVGIAILPACQARTGIPGVVGRPLSGPNTASDLLLAHPSHEAHPLLRSFLKVVDSVAPKPRASRR